MVMDVEVDTEIPLIIGRPFLSTGDAWIGVKDKIVVLQVDGERLVLNMDKAMRYPAEPAQTHQIDQIAQCVENMLEVLVNDKEESTGFEEEIQEVVCELKAIQALDQDDLTPEVQVGCTTEAEQRVPDFHNPSFGVVTQTYHHQTIEGNLSCGKQDRTNEQKARK